MQALRQGGGHILEISSYLQEYAHIFLLFLELMNHHRLFHRYEILLFFYDQRIPQYLYYIWLIIQLDLKSL